MKDRLRLRLIKPLCDRFQKEYKLCQAEFDLSNTETKKAQGIDVAWKEWLVDYLAVFFSGIKPKIYKVKVKRKPLVIGFIDYDKKMVFVDESLSEDQKQYTGWHEFFHWVLEMVLVFFGVSRFVKKASS